MNWLASLGIGLITGVIGLFGTGFLGNLCVHWYRVTSREGAAGYFIIMLALLGGIAGFIIGLIAARVVAAGASPTFLRGLGVASGSVVGLLLVITFLCWLVADLDPKIHGNDIVLHGEMRCPAGFVLPTKPMPQRTWYAHIDTRTRRETSWNDLELKDARQENGRWIIPMSLSLETSVREKLVYVRLDEQTELFVAAFNAKRSSLYNEWSEWRDGGWTPGEPQPPPEKRFNFRYRLEEIQPEPKVASNEPSADDVLAKAQAEETAAYEALSPTSSFEELMRFTHYSQAPERRRHAGSLLAQRPGIVDELSAQILSPSQETSDLALRAVEFLKPMPAGLAKPVADVGDRLLADLARVVKTPVADDPDYQGAAGISVRFSAWFQAHHALHDAGTINGVPTLQRILDLARQREDSYVLKVDVARIAEFYSKEWTKPKP